MRSRTRWVGVWLAMSVAVLGSVPLLAPAAAAQDAAAALTTGAGPVAPAPALLAPAPGLLDPGLGDAVGETDLLVADPLVTDPGVLSSDPAAVVLAARPSGAVPYLARTFELRPLAWGQLYPQDRKLPPVAADAPTDPWGVPMRRWEDGRLYYSPSAITFQALRRLEAYVRTHDPAYLDIVVRMANRLALLTVESGGALWLPFPYDNATQALQAPWYNALAQGTALALFSRLHRLLGDERYLDLAHGVFRSFEGLGPSVGPWVAKVDTDGYLWLEHYPGGKRGKVLNAHLYALFGLRDYWQELEPTDIRKAAARQVLEGAITTMRDRAERFRRPGKVSWYCLRNPVAHRLYHGYHVRQLRALAAASGDPWFDDLATVLAGDYP